ncbi:hypothetical protein Poly51_57860 [Rubripirellula tenax]|uniref:Uncharacterized protein n=1 Tax=Rubripirellula tenax TaxID=2528015 RepID=A0A5C6E9W2_9BACT|nr:hypothetical protein Poly51_57860 [Rubripirellula tenax]
MNSSREVRRREQGVEQPLATELMLPMPINELHCRVAIRKYVIHFVGVPPLLGKVASIVDRQWLRKAFWISHDVDEFCQNLRSQREPIAVIEQPCECRFCILMKRMLGDSGRNEEPSIQSMVQFCCSSISSSRSLLASSYERT